LNTDEHCCSVSLEDKNGQYQGCELEKSLLTRLVFEKQLNVLWLLFFDLFCPLARLVHLLVQA
jgi:hypothetical protein